MTSHHYVLTCLTLMLAIYQNKTKFNTRRQQHLKHEFYMKGNIFRQEAIPACIVPLSEPAFECLVAEQKTQITSKGGSELLEWKIHRGIARDLNRIGQKACRSACLIDCALAIEYPNNPEHPEHSKAIEVNCNKQLCQNRGVLAVGAHVIKLARSQKILRKMKKITKKR